MYIELLKLQGFFLSNILKLKGFLGVLQGFFLSNILKLKGFLGVLVNRETKRNAKRNETEATPTNLLLPRKRITAHGVFSLVPNDSLPGSTVLER